MLKRPEVGSNRWSCDSQSNALIARPRSPALYKTYMAGEKNLHVNKYSSWFSGYICVNKLPKCVMFVLSTGVAGGLDVLLVSGNQVVSGNITFVNGIWLDGASFVTGLVDGVDIPALAADAVYDTGNQNISGKLLKKACTFTGRILTRIRLHNSPNPLGFVLKDKKKKRGRGKKM